MWAERIGDGNLFRVQSIPFYVFGVSYGDVVYATSLSEGDFRFVGVEKHSGHSTYRMFVFNGVDDNEDFDSYWVRLELLGCSYERVDDKLIALNVPATSGIHDVYDVLEDGYERTIWDFQEAHVGHRVNSSDY